MNTYITAQINTIISAVNTFKQGCELAAMKDDGQISGEEAKTLKRINAAADQFLKKISKLK